MLAVFFGNGGRLWLAERLATIAPPLEVAPSHEVTLTYVRGLNLAGFELFDETNRYEIDFAKGW